MEKTALHYSRVAGLVVMLLVLAASRAASAAEWAYVARPGDDLWKITGRYLKDARYVSQLQAYNRIEDPSRIRPGTRIRIPVEWSKFTPVPAEAVKVSGEVLYRTGQRYEQSPLKPGTALVIGSEISTGADGSAFLRFADGSELALRPNSTIKLDSMSAFGDSGMVDSRVRLLEGRLEFEVKRKPEGESHFEVTTPAATTAVRGTVFRVSSTAGDATARTEVTEGRVAVVGAGTEREVREEFGTLVRKGGAPLPPIPLLRGPDLSALPARIEQTAFLLEWPDLDTASGYRAQIAASAGFETTVFDRTSRRPRIGIAGLPDGDYHVRIRAFDKQDLEGLDETTIFTLDARPESPVVTSPLPGRTLDGEDPLLRWATMENAGAYHVQIARDSAFTDVIAGADDLAGTTFKPGRLSDGGYFWRVALTSNSGERGPYSPPMPFTVVSSRPSAKPGAPGTDDDRMTFAWAGAEYFRYVFQLARDPAFEVILVDRIVEKPEVDMEKLLGGRYFLRIATIDESGYQTPFSATGYVDTPLF